MVRVTVEAAICPVICTTPERPASIAYVPLPLPAPSTVRIRLAPTIEKFSAHVPATVADGALGLEHAAIKSTAQNNHRIASV